MKLSRDEKESVSSKSMMFRQLENQKRFVIMTLLFMGFFMIALLCYTFLRFHSIQKQMEGLQSQLQAEKQTVSENAQSDQELSQAEADGSSDSLEEKKTGKAEDEIVDDVRVYLTFDDGPGPYTTKILDVLKKYHVKATFFVIAQEEEEYREIYQRIVEEGHTLAMHSFTHQYGTIYASREAFENDVLSLQEFLYDITGVKSKFYRFPGGSNNLVSSIDLSTVLPFLKENGIEYFDWNVDSRDAASPDEDPEAFINHVVENVCAQPTSIVLMHDSSSSSLAADALEGLINRLQTMGLRLLPITEDTDTVHFIE